jgi:hypothetical protein
VSPQRIQLKRSKGWRKPEGVIVVSRPSKWGNPYSVRREDNDSDTWVVVEPDGTPEGTEIEWASSKSEATELAVEMFRHEREHTAYPSDDEIRAELAGRDLACWCPAGPCHADVLLEIANRDLS